jgi:hypothetical protein
MKTVEEWYKYLPNDIMQLALANTPKKNLKKMARSLSVVLKDPDLSFLQREASPGEAFWEEVVNRIDNNPFFKPENLDSPLSSLLKPGDRVFIELEVYEVDDDEVKYGFPIRVLNLNWANLNVDKHIHPYDIILRPDGIE